MKRKNLIIVGIILIFALVVVGCSSDKAKDEKIKELEAKISELEKEIDANKEDTKEETKEEQTNEKSENNISEEPPLKLNEPLDIIHLDNPTETIARVTINKVYNTDERNQFEEIEYEQVVLIDYEVENVTLDDLFIFESNFKVIDEGKNLLKTYPLSTDSPGRLPPGTKGQGTMCYGVKSPSKNLKIMFSFNVFDDPIATFEVPIE